MARADLHSEVEGGQQTLAVTPTSVPEHICAAQCLQSKERQLSVLPQGVCQLKNLLNEILICLRDASASCAARIFARVRPISAERFDQLRVALLKQGADDKIKPIA